MKQRDEEAIVLDIRTARDADRSVLLLAASGELVTTFAPAAARSRRRFGGTLMPGARVRARWTVRREGGIAILQEMSLIDAAPPPDPLERFYAATHLLELTRAFAREGAEDPRLYRLLQATLSALAGDAPVDAVSRYHEAWLLRLAGLLPETDACAACGRPLEGEGLCLAAESGATCSEHAPPGARHLGRAAAGWLARTRTAPPGALPELAGPDGEALASVLQGMIVAFTERRLRSWPALVGLRARGKEPRG